MTELGDALTSCTEQLILVREEKECLVIEATNKIASEQKKSRDLLQKLEGANKRFAKAATENYNPRTSVNSQDKLIGELNESKAHSDQKLPERTARLEYTEKQCASLQYEVRMLQKKLEIRNKEREYDLKSIDAAQKQHQESVKKITTLESECQRLRNMVQKRLPGPAALAKMKDEVERQGIAKKRTGTSKSTMVQPSLQVSTQRHPVSEAYLLKLQDMCDENRHLRELLASKESDLQLLQLQYADEASKLSVVQRQLKELWNDHELEENSHSEQFSSSLVSNPQYISIGKKRTSQSQSRRIAGSDMQLLVDLAEIENLEMPSRPSSAPHQDATDACDTDCKMVQSEIVGRDQIPEDGFFDKYPECIQDVLKLIVHKHRADKTGVDVILDELTHALGSGISAKENDDASLPCEQAEIDSMVATLIKRVSCMIKRCTESNVVGEFLLHETTELTFQLEHLVYVCSDVLDGKANLQKFIDEICLTLEWVVNRCFSCTDGLDHVDCVTHYSCGNESLRTLSMHEKQAMQSAKSEIVIGMQQEVQKELIETTEVQMPDDILENLKNCSQIKFSTSKTDEELLAFRQEHSDNCQEMQSVYYEAESAAADGSLEILPDEEGKQVIMSSTISATAKKLAECQETIRNLNKQLQALQSPASTDASDKGLSVTNILSEEVLSPEDRSSPTSEEAAARKKEQGKPAATEKSLAPEQDAGTGHGVDSNGATELAVPPVAPRSPRVSVSSDMKKKKQRAIWLSRLVFRKMA